MDGYPVRKNRRQKWVVRGALTILGLCTINGAYHFGQEGYAMLSGSNANAGVLQPKEDEQPPPIPDAAKGAAESFDFVWMGANPKTNPDDKMKLLEPYMTPQLKQKIQENPDLMVRIDGKRPVEVTGAKRWDESSKWIRPGKEALVTVRVTTADGRVWYLNNPVEKSGSGWFVSGLPALVPPPKPSDSNSASMETAPTLEPAEERGIQASLDNFFDAWLVGDMEAVDRYTSETFRKRLPSTDLMDEVAAVYRGVEIVPIKKDPIQIKALVKIEEGLGATYVMEYVVTVKKQNGQWVVDDMKM